MGRPWTQQSVLCCRHVHYIRRQGDAIWRSEGFGDTLRYSTPGKSGDAQEVLQCNYGIAFGGNYLTAFLVKEILADILGHLTGAGGPQLANFEKVCELIGKFHQHFCENLGSELEFGEDLEFFFGGFCPV